MIRDKRKNVTVYGLLIIAFLIVMITLSSESGLTYNYEESSHSDFKIIDKKVFIYHTISITNENMSDVIFKITQDGSLEEGLVADKEIYGYNNLEADSNLFHIEANSTQDFYVVFKGSLGVSRQRIDRNPPETLHLVEVE